MVNRASKNNKGKVTKNLMAVIGEEEQPRCPVLL